MRCAKYVYSVACGYLTSFDEYANAYLERVTEVFTLNGVPERHQLIEGLKHPENCVPIRGETLARVERNGTVPMQFNVRKYDMAYFRKAAIENVEFADVHNI